MIVRKTLKFKLYASHRNRKLHRQINAAGLAYNHCVGLHKKYYGIYHKHLNANKLKVHLTKIKKLKRFSYLTEIGSQALQDVVERIEHGFKLFFRNLKHKVRTAPPRRRKVCKAKSFTLKQAGWKLDEATHTITINGQKYRYHQSRLIEGKIKTVTIKRDSLNNLYVYFSCEVEQNEVLPRMGESIGFDFGFQTKMLIAPTKGHDVDMPRFVQKDLKEIKAAGRKLSRKKKGSHNRRRARLQLARLYESTRNRRTDAHWKLAYELCGKYSVICLETLNIKSFQRKHGRKVCEYGYSEFLNILECVAPRCGTTIIKIDRLFPSTQLCYDCGYKNKALKDEKIREWDCPNCGVHHDRDRNAAKNILREGLRILAAA